MTEQDQALLKELLAGEHGKLIQGFADSRVTSALKVRTEKEVTFPKAAERLAAIEKAAAERIRALELKLHATKRCHEERLDPAIIDRLNLAFADEEDVDRKLSTLAEATVARETADMNALARSMPKPGAGSGHSRPEPYAGFRLTPQERLAARTFEKMDMT